MGNYKAMLFDLDDTLVNREDAVDRIFSIVLEKCYGDVEDSMQEAMLKKFKAYDQRNYGNNDKLKIFEPFFAAFPPKQRLPVKDIQNFWDRTFPQCFSADEMTIKVIQTIKKHVQIAIITNGSTERQQAKINNAQLDAYFETIIISEEVGLLKPDQRIFDLTLSKLNVEPEEALYVGDHLVNDIFGSQHANMKGIWFNPHRLENNTDIKPYAEIDSLDQLIQLVT